MALELVVPWSMESRYRLILFSPSLSYLFVYLLFWTGMPRSFETNTRQQTHNPLKMLQKMLKKTKLHSSRVYKRSLFRIRTTTGTMEDY
jgi:hypothetical protein